MASDRRHGANWPLFRTEQELARMRQRSRILCQSNEYAKGLSRNLSNYVLGEGCTYEAISKQKPDDADPDKPGKQTALDGLIAQGQDFTDRFLESNRWNTATSHEDTGPLASTREREICRRLFRDGEVFIRLFHQPDGTTFTRFVEPEQITNPPGGTPETGWTFGIQHQMDADGEDVETIIAYGVLDSTGKVSEVAAAEMIHLKGPDADSTVKRGLPELAFDAGDALERAAKLQRNISIGAAVRAATAEVWKHVGQTQSGVTGLALNRAERQITNPYTGLSENIERIKPGSIRRVPEGQEPVPMPADTGVSEHLAAVQGDLRQAATGSCAPEYLASGDASNANYASTTVAGAPFTQYCKALQAYFKAVFARVVWAAIKWAVQQGALSASVLTLLDIQVTAPTVVIRDEGHQIQEDQALVTMGVKSKQTTAGEYGLDWQVEKTNMQEEAESGMLATPLPLPGEENKPPQLPPLG